MYALYDLEKGKFVNRNKAIQRCERLGDVQILHYFILNKITNSFIKESSNVLYVALGEFVSYSLNFAAFYRRH